MSRVRLLAVAALAVAACSSTSDKPGAVLHGPAALAIFEGFVRHDTGTFRPYLAVANERGDELRLVDLSDNHVVESPGLAFPLSVPFLGRPMMLVSADLHDGPSMPWALAVVEAGSTTIDLIDTWSGYPVVAAKVQLPADGEVLAIGSAAVPDAITPTAPAAGRARLVVAMTGGRLQIVDLKRKLDASSLPTTEVYAVGTTELTGLPAGVTVSSLSEGAAPGVLWAGSTGADTGYGVVRIALPNALAGWSFNGYATGLPIEAVAAVTFADWDYGPTATPTLPPTITSTVRERVVAVPTASACSPARAVCGLLLLDPSSADPLKLPRSWVPTASSVATDGAYLLPIDLPAPVTALAGAGRATSALMPLVSGAGTVNTSGLAVVTSADGAIYFVDVAQWAMISETSPLVGAGRARVSSAKSSQGTIGLSDGTVTTVDSTLLPARVAVVPGFTPDEDWTLSWQGILPGLETRGAIFRRSGLARTVAVQVPAYSSADLVALGVGVGDLVGITGAETWCPAGTELATAAAASGSTVEVTVPAGNCLEAVPDGTSLPITATFRAQGLVLVGAKAGHAGRPVAGTPFSFAGTRQFYVTDRCTAGECVTNWPGLTFPFPSGPAVRFTAGLIGTPARNDALVFTTKSGVVPTGRRPIVDGRVVAADLPLGLALRDTGGSGVGVSVYASFTPGVLVLLSAGAATNSVTVLR